MKGKDHFSCSSSASTAIMDQKAIVRRVHTVPISDHVHVSLKNQSHRFLIPCSFDQLPIDPKPLYEKCRKNLSSSDRDHLRRKSTSSSTTYRCHGDDPTVPFIDWLSETDVKLVPSAHHKVAAASNSRMRLILTANDGPSAAPLRPSSSNRSRNQVVALRVSVNCKGCEEKLRKHLSKMEGVTSFGIDLATKKVTVIGDVTPLGVLASVSKVMKAQLWSSTKCQNPHHLHHILDDHHE